MTCKRWVRPALASIAAAVSFVALGEGNPEGIAGDPCLLREAAQATRCGGAEPPLVESFEVLQAPLMEEPAARIPFRDPVFGRCVTRLTDRIADLAPGDPSQGFKNEYSRVQSFNADESLILIRGTEATWYLYRADTLQPWGPWPCRGAWTRAGTRRTRAFSTMWTARSS